MNPTVNSEISNVSPAPSSGHSLETSKPANEHFDKLSMTGTILELEVPVQLADELGFDYQRWQAGEADMAAGRVSPFADVMNALRARGHPHGS